MQISLREHKETCVPLLMPVGPSSFHRHFLHVKSCSLHCFSLAFGSCPCECLCCYIKRKHKAIQWRMICPSYRFLRSRFDPALRSERRLSGQLSGLCYCLTDNSYTGWIRHAEGKPMEWIFHHYGAGTLLQNNNLKNKFSYMRNTDTGQVTIKGPNPQLFP